MCRRLYGWFGHSAIRPTAGWVACGPGVCLGIQARTASVADVSGFIELGGTDLYYDEVGSGPAVLFMHAGVADSRMWNRQWDLDGSRLIRFDMRGFGQSALGQDGFTDHADASTVLDRLRVEKAVVVGCSIGAAATLQLANSSPEQIAGLILVGADAPGFDPHIEYESPEWPEALKAFEAGDLRRVAELDAEMWLAGRDRSIDDIDGSLVDLFIDMDMRALANEVQRDELDESQPLTRLPDIDVPVQVVVGDRDLPKLVAAAEHLAEHMSDRPAAVFADTAHLPSMDRPDVFNPMIEQFLAAI